MPDNANQPSGSPPPDTKQAKVESGKDAAADPKLTAEPRSVQYGKKGKKLFGRPVGDDG